jgi:hypothetical protein
MRIGLLVHARGDHVFAPTHWGHQRGHSQQGYAQWHGDRHVMRSAAVPCARLDLWALGTRSDEGAVSVVYGGIGPRCRCRALPPIPDSARRLGVCRWPCYRLLPPDGGRFSSGHLGPAPRRAALLSSISRSIRTTLTRRFDTAHRRSQRLPLFRENQDVKGKPLCGA